MDSVYRECTRCGEIQKTSPIMIEPHPENPPISLMQQIQERADRHRGNIWDDAPAEAELLYGVGNRPRTPEISTRLSYEQELRNTWLRHKEIMAKRFDFECKSYLLAWRWDRIWAD
jgi:hypothetical protein